MGYFSNGSEGEIYWFSYCKKCNNWTKREGELEFGCPIWDLHILYQYNLCNSRSLAKKILDFLIPTNKKECNNEKCSMFLSD